MKYIIYILLLLQIHFVRSQGDGIAAGAAHYLLWSEEKSSIDDILRGQEQLLAANTVLALEQAKLLDVSKKQYHSLSSNKAVQNAGLIGLIATRALTLNEINGKLLTLISNSDNDILSTVFVPAITELFTEQGTILLDVYIATREGKNYLMNNADRISLLMDILSKIDRINDNARILLTQAEILSKIQQPTNLRPIYYDSNAAAQEAKQTIKTLIK